MNAIVNPVILRVVDEFLKPGRYLNLPYTMHVLTEAQRAGKQVLILYRGSDAVLRAIAGAVNGVGDSNGLQIKVNLSGPRDLTPRAIESFVDINLVNSGEITLQELNDLFPCVKIPVPREIILGYGGYKPVYIRPFNDDELLQEAFIIS